MSTSLATSLAPAAWPACTSALRLDRWLAGELPPAEAEDLRAHLDGCARCAEAASELRAARDGAILPPLGLAGTGAAPVAPVLRLSRRRRVLSVALGGLAAAAGLAVVLRGGPDGDLRVKGAGPSLGVWVLHDGAVRRAAPGEAVSPGDALRFSVSAPAPGYVAVLSVDPTGRASVYFPTGSRAEPVAAGAEVALPLATRLDATVGEERLVGLVCRSPVELEPIRAALEAGHRLEAGAGAPDGCQVLPWHFVKR